MSDVITQDMVIRDVRDRHPGITAVFQAHGLPCAGCHVGSYETIAGGARTHSLDVHAILIDLNRYAKDGTVPAAKSRPMPMMAQKPRMADVKVEGVRHVVAIVSGKGGVGKSLVTGLLAVTLKRQGYKVGILDGDITGPSIPRMFGVPVRSLTQAPGQEKPNPPMSPGGIPVMSMNVLLDDPEAAVIWRGPMISNAIRQFFTEMNWGNLDYLLVDLPPGTSDAPMTVMQQLPTDGAIVVATPQGLATMVVSKAIQMVKKFEVPIVGVVENMSYVELPDGTQFELFGPSQGQHLVALSSAPLLGRLPIDPHISELCDAGRIEEYQSDPYRSMTQNFLTRLEEGASAGPALPIISSRTLAREGRANGPEPGRATSSISTLPMAQRHAAASSSAHATGPSPSEQAPGPGPDAAAPKPGAMTRLGRFLKPDK